VVVNLQRPANVTLRVVEVTVRIGELFLPRAEEEVYRGSEVKGFDVLIVELDGPSAMIEREALLAAVVKVASDVILGLALALRVGPRSVGPTAHASDHRGHD
jgi:hypothetical protein